ncbi:hypothetical protein HNS38_10900 [Lentimicrobium sp. L6]|nr:hypothetical protein [Lentimicrobium sp. L6]NPD85271.1 hypothetical protein [Lentimicrobium sp. L6]
MKRLLLLIILLPLLSCEKDIETENEKAIVATIHYLEESNFLNGTVFPRLGPPPPYPFPGTELDSTVLNQLIRNDRVYRENIKWYYLRRINTPIQDSSYIFLSMSDSLFSNYSWATIKNNDNKIYHFLIDSLKSNSKERTKARVKKLNTSLYMKYRLKSFSEFDNEFKDLFYNMYPFLYGGHIRFSRFFHDDQLGIIMFEYWGCEMDCGVGFIAL